jgi:hypothetical protein
MKKDHSGDDEVNSFVTASKRRNHARCPKSVDICHEITTTLSMINDGEFKNALSALRDHLKNKGPTEDISFNVKLGFANSRCEAFVKSLHKIV